MSSDVLTLGRHITLLPIVHGSGDFAIEVRRRLLAGSFDCVAVPLPRSFQKQVEAALDWLPTPTLVVQPEAIEFHSEWSADAALDDEADGGDQRTFSYVPLDPCQPVIAALRAAREERIPRAFIDLETNRFEPYGQTTPDAYALKQVALERLRRRYCR